MKETVLASGGELELVEVVLYGNSIMPSELVRNFPQPVFELAIREYILTKIGSSWEFSDQHVCKMTYRLATCNVDQFLTWSETSQGHEFWKQISHGDLSPFIHKYGSIFRYNRPINKKKKEVKKEPVKEDIMKLFSI